jgi:hypothetical protein
VETSIPVLTLKDRLSFFQNTKSPHAWIGHFRGSPKRFKSTDGEAIVQAIIEAKENPIVRPYDESKLS